MDDDSPDGTAETVRRSCTGDDEVKVIARRNNRGLANSIREGIEKSSGAYILVMDSDGNHRAEDAAMMFNVNKHADIVTGSRFIYGGGMPNRFRYFLSYLYNIFIRCTLATRVNDNLSGFFCIKREKVMALDFDKIFWGYGDYFLRLLLLVQRQRFKLIEVPVLYGERMGGSSKTGFLSVFVRYTGEVFKLIWLRALKRW